MLQNIGLSSYPEYRRENIFSVFNDFNSTFSIIHADTKELKEQVYKLRFQSYCSESNILDKENYPDGLEFDELDHNSQHALLIHKPTGLALGTTRIILPDVNKNSVVNGCKSLTYFQESIPVINKRPYVEASRFCIAKDLRNKVKKSLEQKIKSRQMDEDTMHCEMKTFNRITLYASIGLIRAIFEMALEHNYTCVYAITELSLIKLLDRFGIHGEIIGPAIEYSGKCYPVEFSFFEILNEIEKENIDVWKILSDNGRLKDAIDLLGDIRDRA